MRTLQRETDELPTAIDPDPLAEGLRDPVWLARQDDRPLAVDVFRHAVELGHAARFHGLAQTALRLARRFDAERRETLQRAAFERSCWLIRELESLEDFTAQLDEKMAEAAAINVCFARDDLESALWILRMFGTEDELEEALQRVDDEVVVHLSTIDFWLDSYNERLLEIAAYDPLAWWGGGQWGA